MKCTKCGYENKKNAKFCSKCGQSLEVPVSYEKSKSNSKIIIATLIIVIVILALGVAYFAFFDNNNVVSNSQPSQASSSQENTTASEESPQTTQTTSTVSESKDWVLIGSYTGSGSGTQTISVPAGEIMVKLSAYPIKNYATNHLYVSGSNGKSAGVDWGSNSAVETRSDSLTYTSSSPQTFTIDYYETVSWQVDFYRYQ